MMRKHQAFNILRRSKLSLAVLAVGSGCILGDVALAQDEGDLEEVVVTGSRIRQVTGMTAPTPVTAVTMDELVNLNPGSTIAEQLDNLPQFFSTATAQRGGNSISANAGGSYLNLRGMGFNRTLVLLDGTRIIPADANGSVNIDNFPSALMQRVDVVTGGASAAYGADAIAGVVNFVLDREFEGLRTRVSTGITEEMDGENYTISLAGGRSFMDGRLHLVGAVDANKIDQIGPDASRVDNWEEWGHVRNPNWVSATATPNEPQRITVPHVFSSRTSPQGMILPVAGVPDFAYSNWTFTDDGTDIRPYAFGDYLSTEGAGNQNNQSAGPEYLYNRLATRRGVQGNDVNRRSFFLGFKYNVSDNLSIHGQSILGRSESNFYGQPSNMAFAGPGPYAWTINRENPYLPERLAAEMDLNGLDSIQISKTGVIDGPGLVNIYDNRGNRSIGQLESHTVGFDYSFNNGWNFTGNFQRGESKVSTGILNVPRIDKFFMAMDAVRHPETGEIVCNIALRNPSAGELAAFMEGKTLPSPIDPMGVPGDSPIGPMDPQACVPFNPFGIGTANLAAKQWIEDEEKKHSRILEQDFAELLLTGTVYEGWGAGPIAMALGATWREEEFTQVNRPVYGERGVLNAEELGIRNIPSGFANAGNRSLHPFSSIGVGGGERRIWEYYTEFQVPIWEWDSGQSIGSTLAYRNSDYGRAGDQKSWKLGLDAQLTQDLRWRYTKSNDIREPNFAEVFLTGTGGGAVDDPFRGDERNNTLTSLSTPNLGLGPETGETVTTGFVYQPTFASWIEGMQISIDWYEINLEGAIAAYGNQRIVDDCFATGLASVCDLIQRVATTDGSIGPISRILNQNVNADKAQTRGVDLELQYMMEPNFFADHAETFSVRGLVGKLSENSTTTFAGTTQDALFRVDRPEYSANLTMNYGLGPWGLMMQANYDGKTMVNILWEEGVDVDDNWVASQTIINSALSYRGELASGAQWRAAFNITNLLDRAAPIIAGAGGQTDSISHDTLGRRYQLSLNMDF